MVAYKEVEKRIIDSFVATLNAYWRYIEEKDAIVEGENGLTNSIWYLMGASHQAQCLVHGRPYKALKEFTNSLVYVQTYKELVDAILKTINTINELSGKGGEKNERVEMP